MLTLERATLGTMGKINKKPNSARSPKPAAPGGKSPGKGGGKSPQGGMKPGMPLNTSKGVFTFTMVTDGCYIEHKV